MWRSQSSGKFRRTRGRERQIRELGVGGSCVTTHTRTWWPGRRAGCDVCSRHRRRALYRGVDEAGCSVLALVTPRRLRGVDQAQHLFTPHRLLPAVATSRKGALASYAILAFVTEELHTSMRGRGVLPWRVCGDKETCAGRSATSHQSEIAPYRRGVLPSPPPWQRNHTRLRYRLARKAPTFPRLRPVSPAAAMSPSLVLSLVTLAHALGALSVLAVAPLAPFLLESMALSRVQVGLFLPAVYLGGVLMALPAGILTDRLGVRATLGLGQVIIGVMVMLATFTWSLPTFLGCLVVAGFGFSVLNPSTGKAVIEWFPPRRRGFAMGIKQTGLTLGGLIAALTMPPLALFPRMAARAATAGASPCFRRSRLPHLPHAAAASPRAHGVPRVAELGMFLRRPRRHSVSSRGSRSPSPSRPCSRTSRSTPRRPRGVAVAAGQFSLSQRWGARSRLAWAPSATASSAAAAARASCHAPSARRLRGALGERLPTPSRSPRRGGGSGRLRLGRHDLALWRRRWRSIRGMLTAWRWVLVERGCGADIFGLGGRHGLLNGRWWICRTRRRRHHAAATPAWCSVTTSRRPSRGVGAQPLGIGP